MNPGTEGGGVADDRRPALRVPHQRACRARLPGRRGRHPVQQRDARRPCAGRRFRHPQRRRGGASVRAHRRARLRRRASPGVEHDLIPFGMALGNRASLAGLNFVGLKRRGFSHEAIHELRRAYKMLFSGKGTLKERARRRRRGLSRPGGGAADRRLPARGRRPGDLRSARRQGRGGVNAPGGAVRCAARDPLRRRAVSARGRRRRPRRRARAVPDRRGRLVRRRRSKPIRMSGSGSARSASCSPR